MTLFSSSGYTAIYHQMKGCERKESQPTLRYYPGIYLEGLGKTTKIHQDSQSLGRDLNPGPPEFKAEMLTAQLQHFLYKT